MEKKRISLKNILILQLVIIIYTLSGVAAKGASGYETLSWQFIFFYGLEIAILGVYAILWQQIIKRFDLSIAYANRSMAILWSLVWAVIFFHEKITVNNVLGVLIVLAGTILVLPAKLMALLAYRLLKDGAARARDITASYGAPFTKEGYRKYIQETFPAPEDAR